MQVLSRETGILAIQFPRLRILRLWNNFTSDTAASIRNEAATEAFAQCPDLACVMLSDRTKNALSWVYSKGDEGDIREEAGNVHVKEFDRDVWWKVYDV